MSRSFAGYTYQQKLRAGFYGDSFRAHTASGSEGRLTEISPELSGMAGFASTLTSHGSDLGRLSHDNVVNTYSVGSTPDGNLVVVTENIPGLITVEDLLREAAPEPLPQAIAAAIGKQFLAGLAAAHQVGIIHGAIHPRSVVISTDGTVKLDDFAAGHALATAINRETGSPLRDTLTGYLAPEVTRGSRTTRASDVYAAAAVVYVMLSGTLPPGTLDISPGFERMIQQALDNNMLRRFKDGGDLYTNFCEAVVDDLWPQASTEEVAKYAATALERLKKRLSETAPAGDPLAVLDALEAEAEAPAETPRASSEDVNQRVDSLLASLDPPTQVDPRPLQTRDPISELISLSGKTPMPEGIRVLTPPPRPETGQPATAHAALAAISSLDTSDPAPPAAAEQAALDAIDALEASAPDPQPDVEQAALDAIRSLTTSDPAPRPKTSEAAPAAPEPVQDTAPPAKAEPAQAPQRPQPVAPVPVELDPALELSLQKKGSGLARLAWLLVIVGGVAALVWVIRNQAALTERAEKAQAEQEAKNKAALAAFQDSQPKSGRVTIDSTPDEAAVWMLLGRTPVTTTPMSAAMLHELRLELDGHVPKDTRVAGENWSGTGNDLRASVRVTLSPGIPDKPLPAYPPAPPDTASAGLREGQGPMQIESDPPGAQVWLLVGFTPGVQVSGYARADYEFKVSKDGYVPGYIAIKAQDWDGESVSRAIKLQRAAKSR